MNHTQEDFDYALKTWLEGAQAIINRHYKDSSLSVPILSIYKGKRFIKVIKKDSSTSAHCFIDLSNGDVLKAASWNVPAKHARGNIFDEWNGLRYMEWTGAAYLRG